MPGSALWHSRTQLCWACHRSVLRSKAESSGSVTSLPVSTMRRGVYLCWYLRHFCGRVGQGSGFCFCFKGIKLPHSFQWGAPSPRATSQQQCLWHVSASLKLINPCYAAVQGRSLWEALCASCPVSRAWCSVLFLLSAWGPWNTAVVCSLKVFQPPKSLFLAPWVPPSPPPPLSLLRCSSLLGRSWAMGYRRQRQTPQIKCI